MCTEDVFDSLTAVPFGSRKRVVLKPSNDVSSDIGSKITPKSSQISSHLLWGLGAGG